MLSPYIIVLILLVFFTFLSECSKDIEKIIFPIFVLLLFFFLSFRYGQGTDFWGYYYLFSCINSFSDAILNPRDVHSEIGMRLVYALFDDNYSLMLFCLSGINMILFFKLVKNFQFNRLLSLLIFFPTCYLTYYFSAIRQGLALSIFLGFLIEFVIKKKWKMFFFVVFIASTFHISAIILYVIPFVLKYRFCELRKLVFVSFFVGLGIFLLVLANIIYVNFDRMHVSIRSYMLFPYVERLFCFGIIMKMTSQYRYSESDAFFQPIIKMYLFGTALYVMFFSLSSISRLGIYFKSLECIIVPYLIWKTGNRNYLYAMIFSVIAIVMTIKNINSYIVQASYFPGVSVINYPYVSIFNPSDIFLYRPYDLRIDSF